MTNIDLTPAESLLICRALDTRKEWIKNAGQRQGWKESEIAVGMAECIMLYDKIMDAVEAQN